MSLAIACPACGHPGHVPELFQGHRVECPKCNTRFPVTPAVRISQLNADPHPGTVWAPGTSAGAVAGEGPSPVGEETPR
jgi:hypothetical protein